MTAGPSRQSSPPGSLPAIVIPAHNERETIIEVLAEVDRALPCVVYVVDDASEDDTAACARTGGAIVLPLVNQLGAWGATQAGIRFARINGHEIVITMDADGQHDPALIRSLLAPLEAGIADVCIGAWPERGSLARRVAWRLLRASSGVRLEDLTSGFRAYNRRAMRLLADRRATYLDFQDVGVLALLLRNGMRIVDVDTPMRLRRHGASRIFRSWFVVLDYMAHTLLLGAAKRSITRCAAVHDSGHTGHS